MSKSQPQTRSTHFSKEPSSRPRFKMIWIMGSSASFPFFEYRSKDFTSSTSFHAKGCQPPQPYSYRLRAFKGPSPTSACTAPGIKKLNSSTMRRQPFLLISGVSSTNSKASSRAWKSKARRYSGSSNKIGGGSCVTASTASHTHNVFDREWYKATSWK